jgi:hypothetical protein
MGPIVLRMVLPPVPAWKIVAGVIGVVVLTVVVVTVLWWVGTRGLDGKDLVSARLDALKVGLSIGVGSGGLFALYLAWRRQRSCTARKVIAARQAAYRYSLISPLRTRVRNNVRALTPCVRSCCG